MICTAPALVAVGGGFVGTAVAVGGGLVIVGSGVTVATAAVCVGNGDVVGRGVSVGRAVAKGRVRKGVSVGKSKSNKAVGVGCELSLVKTIGLGTLVEGPLGDPARIKLNVTEQRQQTINKASPGSRIFPVCPCWLYAFCNADRNELN